ncbi:methyl-accepting chemotaxis protein [Polaromonas sp.]|uniref:methyl-accepting chemotaxis protein n=1 Tax=Polaromonas sp. TaxID=1869339 RepID=UPI0032669A96
MKGVWNVLERAGLVRNEGGEPPPTDSPGHEELPTDVPFGDGTIASVEEIAGISLAQVYEAAAVPKAPYPAERLLRLLEGLKAMDDGTRRQAIQAMDAADDTWAIGDPIRDASAKVAAIESHASALRASIALAEQETRAEIARLRQQHEVSVVEIKRQMSELEGLLSREIARGTQESATLEAALQAQVERTTRELGSLSRVAGDFRSLVAQFSSNTTN